MNWLHAPSTRFASVTVFLSATIWGVYWIPLRYLESLDINGGWAVALMNLPGALVLIPLVLWQWKKHRPSLHISILIGFFTGLGLAFYATALLYSPVVRVTIFFYLNPIWGTLIGLIWLGEKASWKRWLAIAIGLGGMGLMVAGENLTNLNIGDVYAFFSGVFWAIGASLIKRHDDIPVPGMSMFQFLFTGFGALLLVSLIEPVVFPAQDVFIGALPFSFLVSAGLLLPSIFALFWAQKFLFPGRVGLLMMSEVFVAIISAYLLLPEERLSSLEWIGAGLIIFACVLEVASGSGDKDGDASPAQPA